MLLPARVECSACHERFFFPFETAHYYLGEGLDRKVGKQQDFLDVLKVPVWCNDCDMLSYAEDIRPLRDFELALGAVRAGLDVHYPVYYQPRVMERTPQSERKIEFQKKWGAKRTEEAKRSAEAYLRWRMKRRHAPRALCCGGTRFQRLDDPTRKMQHADCESGTLHHFLQNYHSNGPRQRPINERVYDGEGELIGNLVDEMENPLVKEEVWICIVEPMQYPPPADHMLP